MPLIIYDISCLRDALFYSKVTDPDPGILFGSRSGLYIQIENTPKIEIFFSISINLILLTFILTIPRSDPVHIKIRILFLWLDPVAIFFSRKSDQDPCQLHPDPKPWYIVCPW